MASDDANESRWVLWEGLEGFTKAYRLMVCWLSGADPLKTVFPLSQIKYRFISSPQSFIVDARDDTDIAVAAVTKILNPSRRYRVLIRLRQLATVVVCLAMAVLPLTVLLASSMLPTAAGELLRSALLRPWVCLLSLWLSFIAIGIYYPSYRGPSWLAPDPVDPYIRLVTPGFTGWGWSQAIFAATFIVACEIDGFQLLTLHSMDGITLGTYIKAGIIGAIVTWCYEKVRWNLFTVHVGTIYRKVMKFYDFEDTA